MNESMNVLWWFGLVNVVVAELLCLGRDESYLRELPRRLAPLTQSSIQSSVGIFVQRVFSSSILARLPSYLVFPRPSHPFTLCLGDSPRFPPSSPSPDYSPLFFIERAPGYRNDVRCMLPSCSESSVLLIISCRKCIPPRNLKRS